jgi:hypothetical protein
MTCGGERNKEEEKKYWPTLLFIGGMINLYFCIENITFYTFKKLTVQISR